MRFRNCVRLAALLACALVASAPAQATPPAVAGAPTLRVLVDEDPPFVVRDGERWIGWSIDLWTAIASQEGIEWAIVGEATPAQIVDALAAGSADVGVGDIAVTRDRMARIDFSHPFFHTGSRILVPSMHRGVIGAALGRLATPGHLATLLAALALIAGMSALLYHLARRHDAANFPPTRREGISEAVYLAANALVKGQLDRSVMPGVAGRMLAIFWMTVGTAAVAYLTAAVAAALTVEHLNTQISDVSDLGGKRVAAVAGHRTVDWLTRHGVDVTPQPDLDAAVEALLAHETDAVVHDAPGLAYWKVRHPAAPLVTVGRSFDHKEYAIALGHGSPLRARINLALLTLKEAGFFGELDGRWLGGAEH